MTQIKFMSYSRKKIRRGTAVSESREAPAPLARAPRAKEGCDKTWAVEIK